MSNGRISSLFFKRTSDSCADFKAAAAAESLSTWGAWVFKLFYGAEPFGTISTKFIASLTARILFTASSILSIETSS